MYRVGQGHLWESRVIVLVKDDHIDGEDHVGRRRNIFLILFTLKLSWIYWGKSRRKVNIIQLE